MKQLTGFGFHQYLGDLAARFKPVVYLEIGVCRGASVVAVLKASRDTIKRVILCDNFEGHFGGAGMEGYAEAVKALEEFRDTVDVDWRIGDSKYTVPEIKPFGFVDMALIDGDHTGNGCWIDMSNVLPLLKPDGIMVVDDIEHPVHPDIKGMVDKFCVAYRMEIVEEMDASRSYGVRVLRRKIEP